MVDCSYSSSPRRVLDRWLSGLKKGKVKSLCLFEGERKREKGEILKGKERDIFHRAAYDAGSGGTPGGDSAAYPSSVSVTSLDPGESDYPLPESPSFTMTIQSLIYETPKREQLEAELKTELERLELKFDEDTLSEHEDEHSIQTVSSTSPSVDSGGSKVLGGVPPYEPERELHELLQSRQEEQQLLDKEIEVSWWKLTARIISIHVPEHSRLNLQHELEPSSSQE